MTVAPASRRLSRTPACAVAAHSNLGNLITSNLEAVLGLGKFLRIKAIIFAEVILVLLIFASGAWAADETMTGTASSKIPQQRLQQYSDLSVKWMQEYLRVDTTNPPGNEMRAIDFYKKILDQEAIENRTFEYSPGRGDLWARLPHTIAEAKRPLILLNHMDVVTSDRS